MSEESSQSGPSRLRVSRSQIAPSEFPSDLIGSSQQLGETSAPFDAAQEDSRWTAESQPDSHAGRLHAIMLKSRKPPRDSATPRQSHFISEIRSEPDSDFDTPDVNTPVSRPSQGLRALQDIFRRSEVQESPMPPRKATSSLASEQSEGKPDPTTTEKQSAQRFGIRPILRAKLESTNLDESVGSTSPTESTPRLNSNRSLHPSTHSEISVQGDNKQESHVVNLDSEFPSLENPGELPSRDPTALGHGRTSLLAARSRAISLFEKNYGEISFPSGEVESSTPMKPSLEPRRPSSSAARTRTISNPIHQLGNRSPSSPTGSVSSHHSSTSASLDPATILKEYERERNWNAPRPLSYHSTHSLPIRRLSATSEQSDSGITPRRTRERSDSNGSTTSSLAYGAHGGTPSPSGSIGVSRSVSFSRKGKERARESFPSIDEQIGRISRPTSPMPQLGRATTSPHATSVTGSPRSPRALSAMGSLSRNRTISTPNATAAEVARDRERNWNSPRPTSMYSIPPESTTPPHVHTRTTSLFGIGGLLQGSKDKEDKEKSAEDYSARHGLKRNNTTGRARVESEHTPFGAGLKPSPSLFAKKETSRPASPDPSNVDNTSRSSLTRSSSSSNKIKTFVGNVTDAFKRSPKKEKEKKGIAAGLVTATSLGRDVLGHGNGDSPGETPPSSPERAKKKNAASAVGSALKDTFLRRNRTNSSLQSGTSSGGAKDTESEAESSAENGASGAVRDSGVDFGDPDKGQAEEVKQKMKEMSEEEERRRKIEQREQEEFEERRMMRMREKEKEEDWERKKKDREERQRLEEEQREFEEEELRRQQQRQSNVSRIPLPKVSTPRRTDIDESRLSRALGGSTTPSGTPPRPISISTSSAGNPALEAAKAEESVISLDSPPLTPPPAVSQSVAISPPREELSTIEESRELVEDRPKRRENEVDLGDESDFEAITMEEASEVAGAPLSPQMSPRQEVMETPPRPKWHRPKEPPTPPSPSVELPPLPSDDDALSGDNMSLNSSPVRSGPANGNGHAHGVGENKKALPVPPKTPKFPGAFDLSAFPTSVTKNFQQLAPLDLAGDNSTPEKETLEASYMSDSDVGKTSSTTFRSKSKGKQPARVNVPTTDRLRTMSAPEPSPFVIQNLDAVVKQRYPQAFSAQQQQVTPLRRANSALEPPMTVAKTPAPPGGWAGTPVGPGGSVRKGILKVRFDSLTGPNGIPNEEEAGRVVEGAHAVLRSLIGDTNGEGAFANAFEQSSKGKKPASKAHLVDAFGRELMFAASDGAPIKRLDDKLVNQDDKDSASGSRSTSPGPSREKVMTPPISSDSQGLVPLGPSTGGGTTEASLTPRRKAKMRMVNQFGEEVGDGLGDGDHDSETNPSVIPADSAKQEGLKSLRRELDAVFDTMNDDTSMDRSIDRPSTPLSEKLERDAREAELRRNSDQARAERAKLQRQEQLASNGQIKSKPSSRDASKSKSTRRIPWLNYVTFVLVQIVLLIIMSKFAEIRSEHLFLTTYYDPAYAALSVPGRHDSSNSIMSQWIIPGQEVSMVYILKNWFSSVLYDWFSWNVGGINTMRPIVVPT